MPGDFMPSQFLRRATALISSVSFSLSVAFTLAKAQDAGDIDTLKRQIQQLDKAGKYKDALALERRVAAAIEKVEIASAGRPGAKTIGELVSVAWCALLARDFRTALAASDRAHALAPADLFVETNRAHALLLVGRGGEARDIYFAHRRQPMSLTDAQIWEDVIADDVASLRKAGVQSPALTQINAKL
jgi:hypothetical protein